LSGNSGAGTIFGQGGARPRSPKSGTRNRGLRCNWRVFVSRKQAFSKKKRSSHFFDPKTSFLQKKSFRWILGRCFVLNTAHDTGLSGGKSRPGGGPKYLQGGSCPLLPAPMGGAIIFQSLAPGWLRP